MRWGFGPARTVPPSNRRGSVSTPPAAMRAKPRPAKLRPAKPCRVESGADQLGRQRGVMLLALPGETGLIDIATFLRGLDRIGYDGGVAVEPFSPRVNALPPEQAAAATVASLRQIWQTAGLAP